MESSAALRCFCCSGQSLLSLSTSGIAICVHAAVALGAPYGYLKNWSCLPTRLSSLRVFYISLYFQCPAESLVLNTDLVNTCQMIAWPESRHNFRLPGWVVLSNLLFLNPLFPCLSNECHTLPATYKSLCELK